MLLQKKNTKETQTTQQPSTQQPSTQQPSTSQPSTQNKTTTTIVQHKVQVVLVIQVILKIKIKHSNKYIAHKSILAHL